MKKFSTLIFASVAVFSLGFAVNSAQAVVTVSNTAVTSDTSLNVAPAAASALTIGTTNTTGALTIGSATSQSVSIADDDWSITVAGVGTLNRLDLTGSTSGTVMIQTAAVAGAWALTLPTDDGTPGQVLTTDGAGVSTWTTVAGGGGATVSLDNLAAVAINTSLVSDTNNTDDLGSAAIGWKDVYLRRALFDGAVSGTVTVQAAAAAGTWDLTLPTDDGTSGQVLTTNGLGITSWTTVAGGGGANTALSNLASVAVNESLIPGALEAGTIDLGSTTLPWQDIYITGSSVVPAINFRITGAPTITAKTITLPNATTTLVGTDTTDTLTNKTLTTPTIGSFTNATHNHENATGGGQLNATNVFSAGTIPTARLGSGTANATTFLRGDQTWATPAGSGDVVGPASSVDNEVVLFSGTTGKLIKSATGTGYAKLTSGVLSAQSTPIPVADGGTGATTLGDAGVLIGNGTGAVAVTSAGTAGQFLMSNGAGVDPTFETLSGGGDMTTTTAQTVTGAKTFGAPGNVGKLIIAGSTSGSTILNATAVAGSGTVVLPTSGTLLSDAAAVTTAQGGTGLTSSGASGNVLTSNGTTWTSTAPGTGGTVTSVSVVSANGLAGTVATATTTPAITLSTTVNAPALAGNGTAISAATTTGTGSTVVLATSPTLVTPVLGVATATSINFGQDALNNYDEGTFTPTVDAGASTEPVYTTNTGVYTRVGRLVTVDIYLTGDGGAEGSGTGQMTIALPFTASSTHPTGRFFGGTGINGTGEPDVYGQIAPSATTVSLFRRETTTVVTVTVQGVNIVNFTAADQNNTTRAIRLKFSYFI